jgi:esterase/lipase superfamily enzyme
MQIAAKLRGVFKSPLTLYASNNDFAMQMSRAFSSGIVRAGDVPSIGPVVADGIETIDISDASMGMFSTNHSTFAQREQLVKDIRLMFSENRHPPDARSNAYRQQGEGAKSWWRYIRQP